MKIYKLHGPNITYAVAEVWEGKENYFVPLNNSYGFDVYTKQAFTLECEEVKAPLTNVQAVEAE